MPSTRLKPHHVANFAGVLVLFLGIHGGAILGVLYALPVYCNGSKFCLLFNWTFLCYGLVSMWLNWLLARLVNIKAQCSGLSETRPWCAACQIFAPEGTHHCPICNKCVAMRDHHCYFVAGCVGERNRRFSVQLLFLYLFSGN